MTTLADRRILCKDEVVALTGLSSATIYRMVARGEFPRPVQLSPGRTGWRTDEIEEWLASRPYTAPESLGQVTKAREAELDSKRVKPGRPRKAPPTGETKELPAETVAYQDPIIQDSPRR